MSKKTPHDPYPATLHPERKAVTIHFPNDWAFHGPILASILPEAEDRVIEESRKRARSDGVSESLIERLYGKPVKPQPRHTRRTPE